MTTFPNGHNQTLSEYALRHFNDTRALDAGKPLRKRLNDFLMDTYQSLDLDKHNIIDNFASITVWSRGIFSPDFTGVSLLSLDRQTFQDTPVVWVFENQNTATRVIRDDYLFPFIIASGQPNRAVKQLLQTLLDRDVTILYHGDLDISGIDIASRLKKDVPAIKFPFFTTYEFTKRAQVAIPKNQKASTSYSAFDSLKQLILSTKTTVYEENFDIIEFDNYYRTEHYLKTLKGNT
jgi:hypothetical protein